MADATIDQVPVEGEELLQEESFSERLMDWVRSDLIWYAGSFTVHLLLLSLVLLLPTAIPATQSDTPLLESKAQDEDKKEPQKFDDFKLPDSPDTPPKELIVDPNVQPLKQDAQEAEINDKSEIYQHKGHGELQSADAPVSGAGAVGIGEGPKLNGHLGLGAQKGDPNGSGFGNRGSGQRKRAVALGGGTQLTERAVTAALIWLANHQNYANGNWSLQKFTEQCKPGDKSCTGQGMFLPWGDAGATAMGLLPFLAAGQTHKSKGPYKDHITKGIGWLLRNQQPDGNLAKDSKAQMMYSHGLATIALSEAYGLSGDKQVGQAAQKAVDFILAAQNKEDGGWRYNPGDHGDTSVVGWQLMALKSAHMAGLSIPSEAFHQTSKWLDSVAVHDGTEYSYQPGVAPVNTMTSVGLLCRQYLGANKTTRCWSAALTFS